MIKYKVNIKEDSIILDIMGRKKTFYKDQEVNEDIFIKTYLHFFKKIGTMTGYMANLATPMFIPDPITDFLYKEKDRIEEKKDKNINNIEEPEEVNFEDLFQEDPKD